MSKPFTAIVNAANDEGVAVNYCLHFWARSASTMTEDAENEFLELYGDDAWQARGAEIVAFIPEHVQIYSTSFYNDDASAAGAASFEDTSV